MSILLMSPESLRDYEKRWAESIAKALKEGQSLDPLSDFVPTKKTVLDTGTFR